ncbi:MAG: hypothetical protein ACR2OZ_20555 [Verrucomicrobiales bacterium]
MRSRLAAMANSAAKIDGRSGCWNFAAMDETRPLFEVGRVTATPAAIELLRKVNVDPVTLIDRHVTGDFGEVGKVNPDSLHGDPADGTPTVWRLIPWRF